jgi:5-methylcytosine-specific restriction endonuclease McrA
MRDRFACVYCGRLTIPTQILRLISFAFPREFPYHKNWRGDITPRVYSDIATSLDHVHSVSTGGSWSDTANLATSCWRCNFQKSDRSAASLGWTIREGQEGWDGLTSCYRSLWERLDCPDEGHHRPWIEGFAQDGQA